MNLFEEFEQPSSLTPVPNVGSLLDIPAGNPVVGLKGETFINGGFHHITGIVGEGNVGKTQLALYMFVTVMAWYANTQGLIYDTESNLKKQRQKMIGETLYPNLIYSDEEISAGNGAIDEYDLKRVKFTTIEKYMGDEMWTMIKKVLTKRQQDKSKSHYVDTPFKGGNGKPLQIPSFVATMIDSFSMFQVSAHDDAKEEGLGSKKRNMEGMRDAHAKNQFLLELPAFSVRNNLLTMLTAHIGQQHQLDPMSPPKKILSFLNQKQKIKNVPEKFLFIPQNVWMVFGTNVLYNSSADKTPMYPRSSTNDKVNKDPDLQVMNIMSLRNKSGTSGSAFELLSSQTEGILPALSQFHYCKGLGRFGIGGNLINMHMDFYPEVKFTRNTIREKLREDEKLACAMRLTSEILQALNHYPLLPEETKATPAEIYEKLKADGYNWDELLQTRGHWTTDQYDNPVRFLSGIDLMNMYAGYYKPYWLK